MHLLAVLHLLLLLSVALAVAQAGPPDHPEAEIQGLIMHLSRNGSGHTQKKVDGIISKASTCGDNGGKCMPRRRACRGKVIAANCAKKKVCCKECSAEQGFFYQYSSDQCFKVFDDTARTFDEAKEKCKSHGLVLAKPLDARGLRSYVTQRYHTYTFCWVGARGDGKEFKWISDGLPLSSKSPLWWPGEPGSKVGKDYCLRFLADDVGWTMNPDSPYATAGCSMTYYGAGGSDRPIYTLCELVMT